MFNKRISKTSTRLEAYGSIDELNSCLGVARAAGLIEESEKLIDQVQEKLVGLMGELATLEEDLGLYDKKGYARLNANDLSWIEAAAYKLEQDEDLKFRGWSRPGATGGLGGAMLDLARSTCRRAERRIAQLREQDDLSNNISALFVNRLSDLLWLLARRESAAQNPESV